MRASILGVGFVIVSGALALGSASAGEAPFVHAMERADVGDVRALEVALATVTDQAERLLLQARIAAATLDFRQTRDALRRYARLHDQDPDHQRAYYSLLSDIELTEGNYADAARATSQWEQLPGSKEHPAFAGLEQGRLVAEHLNHVAKQSLRGSVHAASMPATKDVAGLTRVSMRINGHEQEAIVDTGASLSTVNLTTAKRLGLRMIDGAATTRSSTSDSVATRLGVADRLQIGGTTFESVVFLVLEDSQIEFPMPDGKIYRIDAIVGFPVLRRLGRLHFTSGELRVEPPVRAARASRGNMSVIDSRIYVESDVAGLCLPLHLDTGANASDLTALFTADHPEIVKPLETRTRQIGGAGLTSKVEVLSWPDVPVTIGTQRIVLSALEIGTALAPQPDRIGRLGKDVLEGGDYSIDFTAMRLDLYDRSGESVNACAKNPLPPPAGEGA